MKDTQNSARYARIAFRLTLVLIIVLSLQPAAVSAQSDYETDYPACEVGPPVPVDGETSDELEVSLTTDISGSMEGQRLDDAKTASTDFVDRLESDDEAAAVAFSDEPRLDQELTTDHQAVKDEIDSYTAGAIGGGSTTDVAGGISTSHEELINGTNATSGTTKVMIVLTDADTSTIDEQAAIDAATDAEDDGIVIYAIGVGNNVDEQFLEDIATGDERAYLSADSSDLDQIYQDVSEDVESIESDLIVETRSLFRPGQTSPYTVYLNNSTETNRDLINVTGNATLTSTNESVLSVNDNATLTATSDVNTSTWVRLDATHNGSEGCTNVIVTEPDVEDLELLPGFLNRLWALFDDPTIFALLIAGFLSVPAARFTNAFGGLATAQMVVTIGWLAGYIGTGIAMLSVFVALFIGLNLAENIQFQSGGNFGGGFR